MATRIGLGVALLVALTGACSSSDDPSGGAQGAFPCDNPMSKCPNDEPLNPTTCKLITSDPRCGAVAQAYFRCFGDHQVCGSDGKSDQNATNQACAAEYGASQRCAASYFDSGTD